MLYTNMASSINATTPPPTVQPIYGLGGRLLWPRLAVFAATLALLFGSHLLPRREKVLYPQNDLDKSLYADAGWGGNSTAEWLDEGATAWRCQMRLSEFHPVCGLSIDLMPNDSPVQFVDLTSYDEMDIELSYAGPASHLRMYLRNDNPAYAALADISSLIFSSPTLTRSDLESPVVKIKTREFAVDNWWLEERAVPRQYAHPEMDKVVTLGMDFPIAETLGQHDVAIGRIVVTGPRVTGPMRYSIIAGLWLMLISWETALIAIGSYRARKASQLNRAHVQRL